ncbi:MAG: winged helix-turn-helix domain-containing protein [Arcobacter sp.]|uniref:winged helix-turn-helix domain-containing protein n=1 Tax=Arcobacter sp. TaxID=1872629 RepID=UPI003C732C78
MNIKVKVWIEDDKKNLIFGSGKTEILEYIDLTGSISKTAQKVGMNYKKAWSHIKILENYIEDDLVITKKGRGEDSGTKLTPKAKELIELYKILDEDIKEFAKKRFDELFIIKDNKIINPKEKKNV